MALLCSTKILAREDQPTCVPHGETDDQPEQNGYRYILRGLQHKKIQTVTRLVWYQESDLNEALSNEVKLTWCIKINV